MRKTGSVFSLFHYESPRSKIYCRDTRDVGNQSKQVAVLQNYSPRLSHDLNVVSDLGSLCLAFHSAHKGLWSMMYLLLVLPWHFPFISAGSCLQNIGVYVSTNCMFGYFVWD